MGLLCPLCGKEHVGVDRVMAAVLTMLREVNDYEHRRQPPPIPLLLRRKQPAHA